MSQQFKQGDLALIVDCKVPELIGRTVELVRQVDAGGSFETEKNIWINLSEGPAWLVSGDGLIRMDPAGGMHGCEWTLIADRKLIPLRGNFQPERQKSQEVPA